MESERGREKHGVMPARPPMGRDHGGIQALDRAFLILDIIADAGGEAKLTEIAGIAGLNVSTCHHLISTRTTGATSRAAPIAAVTFWAPGSSISARPACARSTCRGARRALSIA
jgi:hypothetical protein